MACVHAPPVGTHAAQELIQVVKALHGVDMDNGERRVQESVRESFALRSKMKGRRPSRVPLLPSNAADGVGDYGWCAKLLSDEADPGITLAQILASITQTQVRTCARGLKLFRVRRQAVAP